MTLHRTNTDFVLIFPDTRTKAHNIGTRIHFDNRNQCHGRTMNNFGKPELGQPSPLWSQRFDMALEPPWCHGRQTGIEVFDQLVRIQQVDVALGHSHFSLAPVNAIHCKTLVPSIPSDTVLIGRTQCAHPCGQLPKSCIAIGLPRASCNNVWRPDATKNTGSHSSMEGCVHEHLEAFGLNLLVVHDYIVKRGAAGDGLHSWPCNCKVTFTATHASRVQPDIGCPLQ